MSSDLERSFCELFRKNLRHVAIESDGGLVPPTRSLSSLSVVNALMLSFTTGTFLDVTK
jgi:hypothetical protein